MAQTAFSIRMDDGLKRDFSRFCENVGMTMSTAFVMFAKTALRERRIPFEIRDFGESVPPFGLRASAEAARIAVAGARAEIRERYMDRPEPTMDEIDAMIADARRERRIRRAGIRTPPEAG